MFDQSNDKHYYSAMNVNGASSVDKKFKEALIFNEIIEEEDINQLCYKYDIMSGKADIPDEVNNNISLLSLATIKRSRRFSQLLGFWEQEKSSKKTVEEKDEAEAAKTNKTQSKYPSTLLGFAATMILSEFLALL